MALRMPFSTNSSTHSSISTTGSTSNPPYTVRLPYDEIFVHGPNVPKKVQKIKTKKKKKEPEKIVPATQTIEQALEKMNARFDEIEKEHFGPKRGKVAFVRLCY